MMNAVAQSTTSGAVPLLARDTAPSEPEQTHLPGPTKPMFRRKGERAVEDTVSPAKDGNGLSDVSKTGLPLPMLFVIVSALVAGLAAFYGLNAKQAQLETALSYEREKDELRVQLTKEQIENAGLRSSILLMTQTCSAAAAIAAPQRGR